MSIAKIWASPALAAFLLIGAVSTGQGQNLDCGDQCHACPSGWEGTNYNPNGFYNMNCYPEIPYCVACPPGLARDHSPSAAAILALIQSEQSAHLVSLALRYRDRLLVSPRRNLVVLKGNGCDPDALASVAFVGTATTEVLVGLGIRLLEDYLVQPPVK